MFVSSMTILQSIINHFKKEKVIESKSEDFPGIMVHFPPHKPCTSTEKGPPKPED